MRSCVIVASARSALLIFIHQVWFRPNEIESILKANAVSGVRWKEIVERVVWETSDGKLEAINRIGQLQVSTKEYADRVAVANKQKKAQ